jgi:hypothetical protein
LTALDLASEVVREYYFSPPDRAAEEREFIAACDRRIASDPEWAGHFTHVRDRAAKRLAKMERDNR